MLLGNEVAHLLERYRVVHDALDITQHQGVESITSVDLHGLLAGATDSVTCHQQQERTDEHGRDAADDEPALNALLTVQLDSTLANEVALARVGTARDGGTWRHANSFLGRFWVR